MPDIANRLVEVVALGDDTADVCIDGVGAPDTGCVVHFDFESAMKAFAKLLSASSHRADWLEDALFKARESRWGRTEFAKFGVSGRISIGRVDVDKGESSSGTVVGSSSGTYSPGD